MDPQINKVHLIYGNSHIKRNAFPKNAKDLREEPPELSLGVGRPRREALGL